MLALNDVQSFALSKFGRAGLVLAKKSPEICLGLGIIGVVGGTVAACFATLKVDRVISESREKLKEINEVLEIASPEEYSEADGKKDMAIVYVRTGVDIILLYLPAIALTGLGIGLIIGSHRILTGRNAALAAAYKMIEEGFKQYRQRVVAEYGEEAEAKMRFGQKEITVMEENKKGKLVEVKKRVLDNKDVAPYSFVFSEKTATQFKRSYDMNMNLLRTTQNYMNDLLRIQGHVFLNEVLDTLGMARTPIGAVTGWVGKGENPHNPDNNGYITFGLLDPLNEEKPNQHDANEQPFYLTFNVDGNIWDLV